MSDSELSFCSDPPEWEFPQPTSLKVSLGFWLIAVSDLEKRRTMKPLSVLLLILPLGKSNEFSSCGSAGTTKMALLSIVYQQVLL